VLTSCGTQSKNDSHAAIDSLQAKLTEAVASAKGHVSVAVITPGGDTITAGERGMQPLMSVFKMHQAVAVAHVLDNMSTSFDSIIHISASELNPSTWSPIVERHGVKDIDMSVDSLLHYLLVYSDNNASNILFGRIVSTDRTDSIVRSISGCRDFRIRYTEHEMQQNHLLSYQNASTAIDCAALIRALWTKPLVSETKQRRIRELLAECNSGQNRMGAAVKEMPDACLAHRTGSGYTNERGEITAVNDVGLILNPDGRQIAMSVLIRDFPGAPDQADSTIAALTRIVLKHFN